MRLLFYSHSGSGNHGCEAIVRGSKLILQALDRPHSIILFSHRCNEEYEYGVDKVVDDIVPIKPIKEYGILYYLKVVLQRVGIKNALVDLKYKPLLKIAKKDDICFAIGGDCYTYDGWPELLGYLHSRLRHKGCKTVLWGVSLSNGLLEDPAIVQDMKDYDLITVRDPITLRLLNEVGVCDNVVLVSDPAFVLEPAPFDIRRFFQNEKSVVGINISPLIISCEARDSITVSNYRNLISFLLDNTDYNILLIPHVVWEGNDDRKALKLLADGYKTDRLYSLNDMDCTKLKGAIGQCRFFVGARTHATIAAYSQIIPTLVVGYSVKAKGIAESIFGSYEHYVVPVQELQDENDLINAFRWIEQHEDSIKQTLAVKIPFFQCQCYEGIEKLKNYDQ